MDLSIIIINYNTNHYTINCIRSIYAETKNIDLEIIVIDNNSQKEDPTLIKEIFSKIKLIINNKNEGFGIGNNLGIRLARGNYILLLNSDTLVLNNALEKSIDFMNSTFAITNNVGLMGCTLLNEDRSFQNSTFGKSSIGGYFINGNPIIRKLLGTEKNEEFDFSIGQFVEGVSGAFMLFRKEVFEKIKPFDPDIFMYSEETELCRERVSKYFKSYYWPKAQIIHYGGKSGVSKEMHHQNILSYALTWHKKGKFQYLLYLSISFVNFVSYILVYPFAGEKIKPFFSNTISGFVRITPYLLFDIPKHNKNWGSRPKPLKLSALK